MTHYDAPYPAYEEPHFEEEPRTSRLAIASLVCSLFICCPVATAIGPLMGLAAIVRINARPDRRGTGIAFAAIVIGVIATAVWAWMIITMYQTTYRPIQEGPREAMRHAFDGNPDQFRNHMFGDAAQASDEEIEAFVAELRSRYGDFISSRLDEDAIRADPPAFEDMLQPVQSSPYLIEFEHATVKADIEYTTADPDTGQFKWGVRFGEIVIYDEELGDVHFPPRPESN